MDIKFSRVFIGYKDFKTESTSKLSNFNFQWTKTLYLNKLKNIAFTFFKGSRCN